MRIAFLMISPEMKWNVGNVVASESKMMKKTEKNPTTTTEKERKPVSKACKFFHNIFNMIKKKKVK